MQTLDQCMSKILVSACLLGDPVRYDGKAKGLDNHLLDSLLQQHRVIRFCPEVYDVIYHQLRIFFGVQFKVKT